MKVCILTTSYPRYQGDYAGNFVHNLAKELVNENINVRVVAPHDINTKDHEFIDGVEIFRFKYWFTKKGQKVAYGLGLPNNISSSIFVNIQMFFFMFFFFIKGLKVAKNCDLLHSQWVVSAYPGYLISRIKNLNCFLTVHGASIFLRRFRFLTELIISKVDFVIFNSSYTKLQTEEMLKKNYQKI